MKKDARTRNSSFRGVKARSGEEIWDSKGNKVDGNTMENILAELRKMNEQKEPNTSYIPGRKHGSLDLRKLHNSPLNVIAANVFATNIESNRDGDRNDITHLSSPHEDDSYIDPRDMTGRGLMKSSRLDYEENNDNDEDVF